VRAAVEDTLALLRFGRMVQGGQGGIVTYLIGSSLESMALGQARRLLSVPADAEVLRALPARLESFRPDAAVFRDTIRFEYTSSAAMLDAPELRARELGARADEQGGFRDRLRRRLFSRYLFQRNATKKMYADGYRAVASAGCSPGAGAGLDAAATKRRLKWTFWKPNLVGRTLFAIAMPSMGRVRYTVCRGDAELSATQLLVALRAHQAERGTLPASLLALAPDYLPVVPVDPFDGQPLRYLPESKVVYSVAENGLDDRGDPEKDYVFTAAF
jgi:hypothetical protein